jgi:hypothetical protein
MIYVEAPIHYLSLLPDEALDWPRVFLAGGITGCRDWQGDVAGALAPFQIVVMNPRRDDFPMGNPEAGKEQIEWEFNHLRVADLIAFWFSNETLQPITLFELGAWSHSDKPLIVGCDIDYPRRFDVEQQLSLVRPDVDVTYSLKHVTNRILRQLEITPQDQHHA